MTDGTVDELGRSSPRNKEAIEDALDSKLNPLPTGGTNFIAGFTLAFQLYPRAGWGGRIRGLQCAVNPGGLAQTSHSIKNQDL